MTYKIAITERAAVDLAKLKRSEPAYYEKAKALIMELETHPANGTGHPEPLRGDRSGQWSRRISLKHRLVYEIMDDVVIVLVLSAWGHYE